METPRAACSYGVRRFHARAVPTEQTSCRWLKPQRRLRDFAGGHRFTPRCGLTAAIDFGLRSPSLGAGSLCLSSNPPTSLSSAWASTRATGATWRGFRIPSSHGSCPRAGRRRSAGKAGGYHDRVRELPGRAGDGGRGRRRRCRRSGRGGRVRPSGRCRCGGRAWRCRPGPLRLRHEGRRRGTGGCGRTRCCHSHQGASKNSDGE